MLERLRAICLALPETKETRTWGHPNFRVGEKIFCSFGEEKGEAAMGFKVGKQIQGVFLEDPRFRKASYVGNYGWVSFLVHAAPLDWDEITGLVHQSFRLIAPARLAKLVR